MFAYDKTFDPEVVLGHCDLISRYSDFAFYFILNSENQCISKLDKIGIFIDMKVH